MSDLVKVSEVIQLMKDNLLKQRDGEIQEAHFVGVQYITDHNDKEAYRRLEKEVNKLTKAWDKMIQKLEDWVLEAEKIEESVESFYGQ